MDSINVKARRLAPLDTPTDLRSDATKDIAGALTFLLTDFFALYLKTKNFHWHMSGPHFRDYHLLLDDQGDQILAATDAIAERVRKIGGTTLRSIGQISRSQRLLDNDADYVTPHDMLAELREDNKQLIAFMRETHDLCDEGNDLLRIVHAVDPVHQDEIPLPLGNTTSCVHREPGLAAGGGILELVGRLHRDESSPRMTSGRTGFMRWQSCGPSTIRLR